MSYFTDHNYTHEALTSEFVDAVIATGNPLAIKAVLYALTVEGVLHQIADHNPPQGWDPMEWAKAYAKWVMMPEDCPKPPPNEF